MSIGGLVSVVIPVFNAESYLVSSIDSILNQTYRNLELICIDDCSSDSSLEILESYGDPRVRVLKNTKNMGVIYTRSKAYSLCRGEFIANMDADDISSHTRIDKQVNFFRSNPDCSVLGGAIRFIDENNKVTGGWNPPILNDDIKAALLFEMALANPTVMFRCEIINKYGVHDEEFYSIEDYELLLRLSLEGICFANLDEPIVDYRIVSSGMTQVNERNKLARRQVHEKLYSRVLQYFQLAPEFSIVHCSVTRQETYSIEVLKEIEVYLVFIFEHIGDGYCDKKALGRKLSYLWSYNCLKASNDISIPFSCIFTIYKLGFNSKAAWLLCKAVVRSRMVLGVNK